MRRIFVMVAVSCVLQGCGCALEPGDSSSPGEYMSGCWSDTKERRTEQFMLPADRL